MKIVFSILIPVYNTEKYIEECINSILIQSYDSYEIILVDDGSTDNSPEICDKFMRNYPNIRVFHQKNSGQLISRCNAAKAAKGDYCIYIDSDDMIVEDALESLYNVITQNHQPDIILYPFYYEKNGKKKLSKTFFEGDRIINEDNMVEIRSLFFTTSIMDSMCTKAIKRDILVKSIYDTEKYESLRSSEDRLQAMWVIDNVSSVFYFNKPLYVYRLFDGSTTRSYSFEAIERHKTLMLYDVEKNYLKKWKLDSEDWLQRFDAGWITYMIYIFLMFYSESTRKDRKRLLSYKWESFLPEEVANLDVKSNQYINDVKKYLYYDILDKNEKKINIYILKRKIRIIYKKMKRRILHNC